MTIDEPLRHIFRLLPAQEKALSRLGLNTVRDLLYHFPSRYFDTGEVARIADLKGGEHAVIFGILSKLKTKKAFRKNLPMAEATLDDGTGKAKIVWFNQPYLAKMLHEGSEVRVEGKVTLKNGFLSISNPKIENAPTLFDEGHSDIIYPVYPESRGITSNWLEHKVRKLLSSEVLKEIEDPIPDSILKTYKLPNLQTALVWIHTPKRLEDAAIARKRFAFEEIFMIQLERQRTRSELAHKPAYDIHESTDDLQEFLNRFPFAPTKAQDKSIKQILADFDKGTPMSRLLEGDVGSGKTLVAAAAAYAVVNSKLQVAYMAPTEILAQQHYESFIKYFSHLPINIGLITGSGCRKFPSKVNPDKWTDISRSQLLKWVSTGEISILVGTHALIQKSVKFKHLALVIIDEQHRFGTAQRQKLARKDEHIPHLLSMTATPIPRTLALTIYGDLDLTLLDEMPAGRKKIITEIITPQDRDRMYTKVSEELAAGRQLYVICPRIDEPDPEKELAVQAKSVKAEAKRLKQEVFPEYEIGILHSKMKPSDKERIMLDFKNKKIDILVATSVVEVGVNVENASLIIIEGAERFGLAQLHQLRGRVLRGTYQPYCFVFADTKSAKTLERLNALKTASNGFELAEFDLAQRGAGELSGIKQWGISDLGMEAIKNIKMVEAARTEAKKLIEDDETLSLYPLLAERLANNSSPIHFE